MAGAFPVEEAPQRRFATISSQDEYLIFPTDLGEADAGFHVRGEMAGYWHHPFRLFRSMHVYCGGERLRPDRVQWYPWKFNATFGEGKLTVSLLTGGGLEISFLWMRHKDMVIDLRPQEVWLSTGRGCSIISKGGSVVLVCGGLEFTVRAERMELRGETLTVGLGRYGSFLILPQGRGSALASYPSHRYLLPLRMVQVEPQGSWVAGACQMAKSNIAMLIQRWGGKHLLTAGHPDFPWFFAIDTFLSARGAMYTGEWRAVADTLRFLASRSSGGRIPHEVVTNGVVYNSGDLEESALFPAVVAEASMWRRSWRLFSELSDTVGRSVRYVWETGLTGRGIMEDQDRGSGIDIDTVCFFTRSLELLLTVPEGVLGATGLGREEVGEMLRSSRRLLEAFWLPETGTYANRIVEGVPRDLGFWTSVLPLFMGMSSEERAREFASSGYLRISGDGGITVSPGGTVMPVNNGIAAIGLMRYGLVGPAMREFLSLSRSLGRYSPGCFPEMSNREGCYLQAWSAAMFIQALVEAIGGYDPTGGGKKRECPEVLEHLGLPSLSMRNVVTPQGQVDIDVLSG